MSRFSRVIFFVVTLVCLAACSRYAKIEGVIKDAAEAEVVVKMLNVNQYQVLDTLKTNSRGEFSCKVKLTPGQPEFVYVFQNEKKIASLLLACGDKVVVVADTLGRATVSGSEESLQLEMIESHFAETKAEIKALSAKVSTADASEAGALRTQLAKLYVDYYRSRVGYVMDNSKSLTVIPVLYQSFSETLPVFGQATDAIIFSNVADSLEMVYPDSKYVKALRKEAQKRVSQMELLSKLSSAKQVNFLDIELPDTKAKKVKLSDVHKKVTLVYFWTASDAAQKMFNLDVLAPVYEKYHDRGFEIYQVSIDVDNGLWARVVREQKLPWVNVSDISGGASPYVLAYNLTKLPSAFLIGGDGMSGAKISDVASLSAAIENALN